MNAILIPEILEKKPYANMELESIKSTIIQGKISHSDIIRLTQTLEEEKNYIAAGNLYRLWIKYSPASNKHFIIYNYATLLQTQKQFIDAKVAYEMCIQLDVNFAQAYINLGLLYEKQGDSTLALATWIQLVNRKKYPRPPEASFLTVALNHIGRVQEDLKNYAESEIALKESLLIDPDQPGVIQHLVHIRQKSCVWPLYIALPRVSINVMKKYTSPLAMLAITNDPQEQLENSKAFVARTYSIEATKIYDGKPYTHQKIRVAYVSGDFRQHAVGFLLPMLLDGHDREVFELYAYDFSREDGSDFRTKLIKKFDYFRSITNLSDLEAAQLISKDEIDILVDLHGISSGARPGIFAMRPAPKQGTYLGFIGPTGMPWFDFVIADDKVLPTELLRYFTEKPIYLNTSFIPSISYQTSIKKPKRKDIGLPEDSFIMGAFSNTYKITPEIYSVWMRLLHRIPNSYLWLIDDNSFTTLNLKREALERGISEDRLIFMPRTNHIEFCARLQLADVYLDTFPYNCGSTANDIIHANVPFVTIYGKTMVSRMGLSILSSLGSENNAVSSFNEYENKVIEEFIRKKNGITAFRYNSSVSLNAKYAFDQLIENPKIQ